jgi:tetratricopeptide (TPR) repeat protein
MMRGNVVLRVTRPAQVIKHLLATISREEVFEAWNSSQPTSAFLSPNLAERENLFAKWSDTADSIPISYSDKPSDMFLYCYHVLYRGRIDRPHEYDLSRAHGADRAKLDLLLRFFNSGSSLQVKTTDEINDYPLLPINYTCELLTAIGVAGLNSGCLQEAVWGARNAQRLLDNWRENFGDSRERRKQIAFVTRLNVDTLVRGGDLKAAEVACRAALREDADFSRSANAIEQRKLRIRFGNIIYLTSGIGEALSYLEELGFDAFADPMSARLNFEDLAGQSGRIWVNLLLRTIPGRARLQQVKILEQAKAIHELNWSQAGSRPNERVALQVEASILNRVSLEALRTRARDLVNHGELGSCLSRVEACRKEAWKRGVSPTTRLDIEFERARLKYLSGSYEAALRVIEGLITVSKGLKFRLYEYDAVLLKSEVLWTMGMPDEAEGLFDRLLEIENETGYKALHPARLFIQMGQQPCRLLLH